MTSTNSVFTLFKKTDFITILASLGVIRCIGDGGHNIFVAEIGGNCSFINTDFL